MSVPAEHPGHIALLLKSLSGGGVPRIMLNLAGELLAHGYRVDLVVCRSEGPMAERVPRGARLVALRRASGWRARRTAARADPEAARVLMRPLLPPRMVRILRHLPALVDYLDTHQPDALLATDLYLNLMAVWARALSSAQARVVVRAAATLTPKRAVPKRWLWGFLPELLHRTYDQADTILAVSEEVADDLAATAGLSRHRIRSVRNPVVTPTLLAQAEDAVQHPWFNPGQPPVIVGAGRLVPQKDFATLIRAFAHLRETHEARLVILGEGRKRRALVRLAGRLGVAADVDLPGWVANPYPYLRCAGAFVLSSAWEGIANVLLEAMACGAPVVATRCPGGPAEILAGGRYGALVPVGDARAMAAAIRDTLASPAEPERLRARAAEFSLERGAADYLATLDPAAPHTGSEERYRVGLA